jgi:hypothetical protein
MSVPYSQARPLEVLRLLLTRIRRTGRVRGLDE